MWAHRPAPLRFGLEFVVLVMPQILLFLLPAHQHLVWATMAAAGCLAAVAAKRPGTTGRPASVADRPAFVTAFRASLMTTTVLAILAVDFSQFPRGLAKTETFGTSMMDVGIGAMIFSGGLVGHRFYARPQTPTLRAVAHSALPMAVLGSVRTALVKLVGYQEHVSEYGVHWNFFLTLAVVPCLCLATSKLVPARLFGIAGILLSAGTSKPASGLCCV